MEIIQSPATYFRAGYFARISGARHFGTLYPTDQSIGENMQHPVFGKWISSALLFAISATLHAATPTHPALRDALLTMRERDQEVRQTTIKAFTSEEEFRQWSQIDKNNQNRLKDIIRQYGWPTISMVGADGAEAA